MENPTREGWGLWSYVPETAEVAWGFRAIDEGGSFSLLYDRQTMVGPDSCQKALARILNSGLLKKFQDKVRELKASGQMRGSEQQEFELYDPSDNWGGAIHCIVNTNASYGYVYGILWFDDETNMEHWSGPGPIPAIGDHVESRVASGVVLGRCVLHDTASVLIVADDNLEAVRERRRDPDYDGITTVFGCDLPVPETVD